MLLWDNLVDFNKMDKVMVMILNNKDSLVVINRVITNIVELKKEINKEIISMVEINKEITNM